MPRFGVTMRVSSIMCERRDCVLKKGVGKKCLGALMDEYDWCMEYG